MAFDDGAAYSAKFSINSLNPMNNELLVEQDGKIVFKAFMQEMADSLRKTADTVTLSREYSVFLVNKVIQDDAKNLKQGDEKVFIFTDANYNSSVIPFSAIAGKGSVSFPDFEPDYVFSITKGNFLEIRTR